MTIENNTRHSSTSADTIKVSESAKRQIAINVSDSKAHLAGTNLGPSFWEGFPDVTQGPNR